MKFLSLIFLQINPNKIIIKKIKTNSPLVNIKIAEIIDKKIILIIFSLSVEENKNFRNNKDKAICKLIDEI